MSLKLKMVGRSFLAAMTVSAVVVINASAQEGGHFLSAEPHTQITGVVGPANTIHTLHFLNHGLAGEIGCNTHFYNGTITSATVTSITMAPSYASCYTTPNGTPGELTITVNDCTFTFTIARIQGSNTEQTSHLLCPPGKRIEIHHPNCTLAIHPQTISTGLTYTNPGGSPHELTLDVNIQFSTTREGLCQFVAPTNGVGTLKGTVTVKGFETEGPQIAITAQ